MWAPPVEHYYLGRGSRDSRYKRGKKRGRVPLAKGQNSSALFFEDTFRSSYLDRSLSFPSTLLERTTNAFSSRSRRRSLKAPRRRYNIASTFVPHRLSFSLSLRRFSALLSLPRIATRLPSVACSSSSIFLGPARLAERLFITGLAFILDLHNLNTEPDRRAAST